MANISYAVSPSSASLKSMKDQRRIIGLILALVFLVARVSSSQVAQDSSGINTHKSGQFKKKHAATKADINAIGNRKIGGVGIGNWYSLESEIRMGREYAEEVDSSVTLLPQPAVNEYVNRIGQNLVLHSDAKVPFTIKVIDSEEVNAFSLPGGFLYVNSGLILAADNEAEIAGAMAHEIAHVAARHATRQMTRSNLADLLCIPLIFVGGGAGLVIHGMTSVAMPLGLLKFSRSFEAEADYLGLEYMYAAGYDPQALITFLEKIREMEHDKRGALTRAFASHPQTADRVKKSEAEIAEILPERQEYVITTSEFETVKTQLIEFENRRQRERENGGPVLRHRTATSSSDNTEDRSDNEHNRPVLKSRDQSQ